MTLALVTEARQEDKRHVYIEMLNLAGLIFGKLRFA